MSNLQLKEVKPGDLITAADWNQMIRVLTDFDARLAILEASSSGGPVAITRLVYTPPLRRGQVLEIQGRNFGTSRGAQQVQFNNRFIIQYGEKSNDSILFVTVPTDLPDIGDEGRDVLLRVSNGASSDFRTIKIFPEEVPTSGNVVDLTWEGIDPNPLRPTQTAILTFKARSRTRNTERFDVTITISDKTLQAGKRLFTGETEVPDFRLNLKPLTDLPFSIRLPALPDSLANGQFRVFILFRSGEMVGSLTKDFEVGQSIIPPDPTIGVAPGRFEVLDSNGFPDSTAGRYEGETNTISLMAGRTGTMTMSSTFELQDKYEYRVKVISGTGWSATIGEGDRGFITIDQGDFAGGSPAQKDLAFALSVTEGADTSGEIEFAVQRQGEKRMKAVRMLLKWLKKG
jgi:hypothetical protein